jgi:hypothetical protein
MCRAAATEHKNYFRGEREEFSLVKIKGVLAHFLKKI